MNSSVIVMYFLKTTVKLHFHQNANKKVPEDGLYMGEIYHFSHAQNNLSLQKCAYKLYFMEVSALCPCLIASSYGLYGCCHFLMWKYIWCILAQSLLKRMLFDLFCRQLHICVYQMYAEISARIRTNSTSKCHSYYFYHV